MTVLWYALPFERALSYWQMFSSSLISSSGDAAYASVPVIRARFVTRKSSVCGSMVKAQTEPSQRRPVRRHRLQPTLVCHFVAPVEGVSASEMPGHAQDFPKGNQRCKVFLILHSTDTLSVSSRDNALCKMISFADSVHFHLTWFGDSFSIV